MKFCVHIGYPKAGSTFLQRLLFSGHHPDIDIIKTEDTGAQEGFIKSGAELFFDSVNGRRSVAPYFFDYEHARETLASLPESRKSLYAISNEDLTGHPFSGGVYSEVISNRIKAVIPEAKIIIVFREQRKMLLSVFADFLERGAGRCSLNRFLSSPLQNQIPWHNPTYFCFSRLVKHYQEQFGAENVLALPLEAFEHDMGKALGRITDFLGVSPCESSVESGYQNRRNYKRYASIRMNPLINMFGGKYPTNGNANLTLRPLRSLLLKVTELAVPAVLCDKVINRDMRKIEEHLKPWVAKDNLELQTLVADNLKAYGYMFDS